MSFDLENDIALCLCNVNFLKLHLLVYDASFVLYSVLSSGVMKLCLIITGSIRNPTVDCSFCLLELNDTATYNVQIF